MAKANLLIWVAAHSPPLAGKCSVVNPGDYNLFNAVTTAAEARAALQSRRPPLTIADIEAAMAEYSK